MTTAWKGPLKDGITFSLLNKFLECRERFRMLTVLGLKDVEEMNEYMEFGNMWHEAEEALSAKRTVKYCLRKMYAYSRNLIKQWPSQRWDIDCMYLRAKILFQEYVAYWKEHPDTRNKKPVLQEESFRVEYTTDYGSTVILRGKFDAVDLIDKGLYLQENKTKSRIDTKGITFTVDQNMQTMLYLTALKKKGMAHPVKGVRYNVVYNSGHKVGGNRTSEADYRERIRADPAKFFHRWRVEVHAQDLRQFQTKVLDPILEQLVQWWEWVSSPEGRAHPFNSTCHWQTPWGLYNSLAQGWRGSYFEYMTTGKSTGLQKTTNLFPEL